MDASDRATALIRARQGDEEAFGALVQQHSRKVFQLAFRMMRNEQDAEDVVQECFLRAYRQLGRFEARADFGTWLYRIAANCAVDMLRTRSHRMNAKSEELDERAPLRETSRPGPDRLAESAEIDRLVNDALGELTAIERAAFTLRHHEGRSIDEICRTLNLGKSAAKHAVFRAVRKLRAVLAPFHLAADVRVES
jgi:RNA polymerase sigma-70 factor (ECF subfamily)